MKIGYLGPKNSFTYQATNAAFLNQTQLAFSTIQKCLEATIAKEVDMAVIPIENSLEGSVHASMDYLFHSKELTVQQEIILPIRQQLMATNPGIPEVIMSHPQALAQSQAYLSAHYPDVAIVQTPSTTYAAEYATSHPQEKVAAIASKQAAAAFGLTIIGQDIQDNDQNETRFWVITRKDKPTESTSKVTQGKLSFFLTLPSNQPGVLHKMLAAFAWRGIDLAKIESRPLKTSLGQYYFIIDLAVEDNVALAYYAFEEVALLGAKIRVLGPYEIRIVK